MTDSDIRDILTEIPELAFITLDNGLESYTPPIHNVWGGRSGPVNEYLDRYSRARGFSGEFFVCLYDGWREYTSPFANPRFTPWDQCHKPHFASKGSAGEPRFINHIRHDIFPVLPLPVLTMCRHRGDTNTLLIPDAEFLGNQFHPFTSKVDASDIPWSEKDGTCLFWRGSANTCFYSNTLQHPRDFAVQHGFPVNAAFQSADISEFLRYKFLLDLDGMVSAWSGFFWKLYSNSLVVKLDSHWEQWYYPMLKDRENVWLTGRDLRATFQELRTADSDFTRTIAEGGKALANKLTYDYAVNEYTIQ